MNAVAYKVYKVYSERLGYKRKGGEYTVTGTLEEKEKKYKNKVGVESYRAVRPAASKW